MDLQVLIVEDFHDDVALMIQELRRAGYEPAYEVVDTELELRNALAQQPWEAVLCDHALPRFNSLRALDVLAELNLDLPFIIVSGVIGEEVAVAAMKAGAHDYVMKSNLARLPAAVERELREAAVRRERWRAEQELREANDHLSQALDELRRVQLRLIQQERLDALRQLASGVVHDVGNLMTRIVGFAELLLIRPDLQANKETLETYLERVRTAGNDAVTILGRLRQFYGEDEPESFEPVYLHDLVRETISLAEDRLRESEDTTAITVETDLGEVPAVIGSAVQLREVLLNLILNAADAMPSGGTLALGTRRERGDVVLSVRDTGVGMAEEVLKRCMEPFFTTKGDRGTGMGLAIAYGVVQRHRGTIGVESEVGRGTSITIRFPGGQ